MIPKKNRLKKKKDFDKVFAQGKGLVGGMLFVKVLKREDSLLRFGFIVSKKISKKAVVRNKIKRRLREIIRELIPKIKEGFDVIIIAMPGIESYKYEEMKRATIFLFKKIGIFKDE